MMSPTNSVPVFFLVSDSVLLPKNALPTACLYTSDSN